MLEYLILNGKFEAAKHFHDNSKTTLREQLLSQFNKGNRAEFMELFNMLHKQSKLEFYLRVYFLIYSIHPALRGKGAIPQPEKVAFKDYLDNKGAQLAKTNEFLEFYALPFIKKPLQHLAFKNLFKKQWVNNLKQKLEIFIAEEQRLLKSQVAKLFEQSSAPTSSSPDTKVFQQKVKEMQKINKKLFEEVKQFTQKYHILEESHKSMIDGFHTHMIESQSKWFQITKQLVASSKTLLEMLINSDSTYLVDKRFIKAKRRIQKYEKFVNKKFDDLLSQSQDISIFERPSINELSYSVTPHTQKSILPNNHGTKYIMNYLPTDYVKLKSALKKGTIHQKIAIINGLYWRVLKSKQKQVRKLNILGILHYDVLGINSGQFEQMLISRQLLSPILRLLQLISLDDDCKKILFSNNDLHKDLIGIITQCQDLTCLQYIIDTIGQISSIRSFKLDLINQDIIEICVDILRSNKYENNESLLESTTAILLNMLEKEEGLRKFEKEKDIFEILKRYIRKNFKITRAIIYGIIYALLQSLQLYKIAQAQKMPQFFKNILTIDPEINKNQYKYIRLKLASFKLKLDEQIQNQQQGNQNDQDDEQDEFLIEDQQIPQAEEMIKNHEQILQNFALKGKEAIRQTQQMKQILHEYQQDKVPKFKNLEENKLPKIQSPKIRQIEPTVETPYIKHSHELQRIPNSERPAAKKVNNYFDIENIKEGHRDRDRMSNKFAQKHQEEIENRRMKKSISADRGIGKSREKDKQHLIYQSNKFPQNKVSQFKAADERNYRSPQQQQPKKRRQEVLKQLNQQIKVEQMMREKKKAGSEIQRDNQLNSYLQQQKSNRYQDGGEAFQSKPKLRRTPPKQ